MLAFFLSPWIVIWSQWIVIWSQWIIIWSQWIVIWSQWIAVAIVHFLHNWLDCKIHCLKTVPNIYNIYYLSLQLYDWQAIVSKCNDLMVSLKQAITYDIYIYIHKMPINWYSYRRWSLGVILYIRPSGTPPFSEDRWLFVSSRLICPSNIDLTVCMAGPVDWIWELKYSR